MGREAAAAEVRHQLHGNAALGRVDGVELRGRTPGALPCGMRRTPMDLVSQDEKADAICVRFGPSFLDELSAEAAEMCTAHIKRS